VKLDGEAVSRCTAYQEGRDRAEFLWRRVGYGAQESRRTPLSGPGSPQAEMAEVESSLDFRPYAVASKWLAQERADFWGAGPGNGGSEK
jgi:hypothetical protein